MIARANVWLPLLVVAVTAGSGCAAFRRIHASTADIDQQQAERAAETVAAFEKQRNFAQFQAAQARWREGNMIACREAVESILQREPTHLEARWLLVQVLLAQEKYDLAHGYLEQILADRPADARAQHTMGLVLDAQGRGSEALGYYRVAAELEPDNEQYALACAACTERCAPCAASSTASDSVTPAGAVDRADDAETSTASFARPEVEQGLTEAEAALARGDTARARDLLTKVVSLDPDAPQVPIRAAVLALRHRQPQLATFVLQPLERRWTDSAAFWRTLGTAYYRQADYPRAQRALQQALSLDNSNALSYVLMGCTLEKLGQTETAAEHHEQARRLDPRLGSQR